MMKVFSFVGVQSV